MKKYLKTGLVVATCALILFVFGLVRLLFLPTASNTKKIEDYGQFRLYSNYEIITGTSIGGVVAEALDRIDGKNDNYIFA